MSAFYMYLSLGFNHIMDIAGYDHILFVATLCAVYVIKEWRQVLVLITAFTIGHSTTLALASLHIISFSSYWIEILIPVTILITAIGNILKKEDLFSRKLHLSKYATAMFFGLIHGLGFSNYLRALLGSETNIVKPLLAFNIGLELGQIIITSVVLLIAYVFINLLKAKKREWSLVLSGAGIGISIILIIERITGLV